MVADGRCGARDISRTRGVLSLPLAVMGHIHVFDGAVDGRWARMLVGREIWYGARGLKKVSFLMESAGRAAVSLSGRVITIQSARAAARALDGYNTPPDTISICPHIAKK